MPRSPMTITRRFSILAPLALGACAAMEARLEPAQDKLNAFGKSADAKIDQWKTTLFRGRAKDAQGRWVELEKKSGGRLGVAVLGGGRVFSHYRGDERFAFALVGARDDGDFATQAILRKRPRQRVFDCRKAHHLAAHLGESFHPPANV